MKNFFKKILIFVLLISSFYLTADFLLAQSTDIGLDYANDIGLAGENDPRVVAVNIIKLILTFLGIFATVIIMYAGWLWMSSEGDPSKIETAKKIITSAIIGLIIIFGSFMIVSWVVNQMDGVMNGGSGTGGGGEIGGGGGTGGGGSSIFYTKKIYPDDGSTEVAINTKIEATFNQTIKSSSVSNSTFRVTSKGSAIAGTLNISGNKIEFIPTGTCPTNSCSAKECFDINTKVDIEIDSGTIGGGGVVNFGGTSLTCNATHPCKVSFTTGSAVSCAGSACAIDLTKSCISGDCHANDSKCSSDFCDCSGTAEECVKAGYSAGITNCCLCQDTPKIEWISPSGNFCDGDHNKFCEQNSDCAGLTPATCNAETPNAKSGNLVTINGKYFGNTAGIVKVGGQISPLANTVNPNCSGAWTNEQIVIVIPSGLSNGSTTIEVIASNNYSDTNNNDRGDKFEFIINGIERPGICSTSPDKGISGDTITYQGIKLNGSNANFGNTEYYVSALASSFIDNLHGTGQVPYIRKGNVTTFVKNSLNINSNYLLFNKLADATSDPYIISFDPKQGSIGQYVTIQGANFGNPAKNNIGANGKYHVYFDLDTDLSNDNQIEANYEFPPDCQDNIWKDNQIIVKTPDLSSLGNKDYIIVIDLNGTIINSSGLINPTFKFDSSLALTPSLCKIEPSRGKVGTEINLFGEYFLVKDNNSKVIFTKNLEQGDFSLWKEDFDGNKTDKVQTKVIAGAVSGLVQIKNNKGLGNGLNFEIGECKTDAECGTDFCCPKDSSKAGSCVSDLNNCYADVKASVYEWGFSTGIGGVDPPNPFEFCSAYDLMQCVSEGCPNSPGECSVGKLSTKATCDCSVYDKDNDGDGINDEIYIYNQYTGKCIKDTAVCSIDKNKILDTLDFSKFDFKCSKVGDNYYWETSVFSDLGDDYKLTLNLNKKYTLIKNADNKGVSCNICEKNLECVADDQEENIGVCSVKKQICTAGVECISGKCNEIETDSCECCCRKNSETTEYQDCCSYEDPNNEGVFKSLTCEGSCGDNDTKYGNCTGCNMNNDQALSDEACNCSTSVGKFCDMTAADGRGECQDCSKLSSEPSDCSIHSSTCCVDGENNNVCRGEKGTKEGESYIDIFGVAYQMIASGDDDYSYCAYHECRDSGFCSGEETPKQVVASSSLPVYSASTTCAENCGAGSGLRPRVVPPTIPDDDELNVCRNVKISAVFDKWMNVGSFAGNVLVVGDYEDKTCPEGTQFLVFNNDFQKNKNIFVRIIDKVVQSIISILPQNIRAYFSVTPTNNYCVIGGSSDASFQTEITKDADGNEIENKKTEMNFTISRLLDANTNYYVIIRGDDTLTESLEGVLSKDGYTLDSNMEETFNSVTYKNSYIWSFTTMDESSPNAGICAVDDIIVTPSSYMFKSTTNDWRDDEDNGDFDINNNDSDKLFVADAITIDKQKLSPIAGVYSWIFNWNIDASDRYIEAKTFSFDDDATVNSKELIQAKSTAVEGETFFDVEFTVENLTGNPQLDKDDPLTKKVPIYIFFCNNPWPVIASDGAWNPWTDETANCDVSPDNCHETSFKLYYCRDDGKEGTFDDLPSLPTIGSEIIVGEKDNLLKQFYFNKEKSLASIVEFPDTGATSSLSVGGKIQLTWIAFTDATDVKEYKIYYGDDYSKSTTTNLITATVDGLTNLKEYCFVVTAIMENGMETEFSEKVCATPKDIEALGAPANFEVSLTAVKGVVKLIWDSVENVKFYRVSWGLKSNTGYGQSKDINTTIVEINNLKEGLEYKFKVETVDESGNISPAIEKELKIE